MGNNTGGGSENVAVGYQAMETNNSDGIQNVAVGYQAMPAITFGGTNVAVGYQALYSNTGGTDNIGIGASSLNNETTGVDNIGIGEDVMWGTTTSSYNVGIGFAALDENTGQYNTAIGQDAGFYNSSGSNNTYVGYDAGAPWGTAITVSNITCVGNDAGDAAEALATNYIYIGSTSTGKTYAPQGITSYSDRRIKDSIKANVPGLAFIIKLRPVTYHLNIHRENQLLGIHDKDWPGRYNGEKICQSGFIAQEVDSAAQACGYNFSAIDKPKTPNGLYGLCYQDFVVPLVKAVQDLNDSLKLENKSLKLAISNLQSQNNKLASAQSQQEKEITELKEQINSVLSKQTGMVQANAK